MKKISYLAPGLFIFCSIFSGCTETPEVADFRQTIREQNETIDELNREVMRLNDEFADTQPPQAKPRNRQVELDDAGLKKAKRQVEDKLSQEVDEGNVAVSMQAKGLVVTVLDRVLFESGKADLLDSAKEALDKMAEILQNEVPDQMVYIEGHTDNVPIGYSNWPSNWELSTARATEVVHYFVEARGLEPQRFAAVGYGEFQPVVSNSTPEGRLVNRRVEIVISPKKYSADLNVVSGT